MGVDLRRPEGDVLAVGEQLVERHLDVRECDPEHLDDLLGPRWETLMPPPSEARDMSRQPWMDRVVADRMAVDREFTQRVNESRFSSQQWGLIMTATEFEIRNPEDAEAARLVADTSKLPQIMPELEKIDAQVQAAGGAGGVSGSGGGGGGVLDSIRSALGLGGGGGNDEDRQAAEALVEEYANRLQERLENQGKWASVREQATD